MFTLHAVGKRGDFVLRKANKEVYIYGVYDIGEKTLKLTQFWSTNFVNTHLECEHIYTYS